MLSFKIYQTIMKDSNYTPHWDLPRWGNALAGETGELCNLVKKIDRGNDDDPTLETAKEAIGEELCDIIAYVTHIANAIGIDLDTTIPKKFNKVMVKMKLQFRL